ncbi:shikimate kinase [Alkalispirochaeta americana]|uniref:Shikimate kinase n=1 Tax=Alkalispirochaeta americana TaxID=159291 RepID=A0A1N6NXV0_9SPIO|nr:shikimate kinase [Alkalispirochaeta americana]SIP96934.1 shikimate kinase [Alkalispirochaeta americana]
MSSPGYLTLTGLKHTGKSSIARGLCQAMPGTACLDTDLVMLEQASQEGLVDIPSSDNAPENNPPGSTVLLRQLYRNLGKKSFTERESLALRHILEEPRQGKAIISTGGGVCDNPEAMELLEQCRPILYLWTDPEVLFERISAGGIPPFLDPQDPRGSFLRLADRRDRLYRQKADHVVDLSDLTVDEAVKAIEKLGYLK